MRLLRTVGSVRRTLSNSNARPSPANGQFPDRSSSCARTSRSLMPKHGRPFTAAFRETFTVCARRKKAGPFSPLLLVESDEGRETWVEGPGPWLDQDWAE
jgi:hypothetical protein